MRSDRFGGRVASRGLGSTISLSRGGIVANFAPGAVASASCPSRHMAVIARSSISRVAELKPTGLPMNGDMGGLLLYRRERQAVSLPSTPGKARPMIT
jgi:hypothetical protein